MGLHFKMTHVQASKKWENLKKRYKVQKQNKKTLDLSSIFSFITFLLQGLKNPPAGVKVYPEAWPFFNLMDDAMEGRLVGDTPLLEALPPSRNFPSILKPKRRRVSMVPNSYMTSVEGGPEIEVTLNGDDDEEAAQDGSIMQEMERNRDLMDSEKQVIERERQVLQRERAVLDREIAALDRERASLERERATVDREKALLEREKTMLERDKEAVRRDRLALEREKARLERLCAPRERTKDASEDSSKGKDSDVTDRKEQFLNLFERLIENF
ncbi:33kDa venom protein isoform X3 [Eleginops maclovinus]